MIYGHFVGSTQQSYVNIIIAQQEALSMFTVTDRKIEVWAFLTFNSSSDCELWGQAFNLGLLTGLTPDLTFSPVPSIQLLQHLAGCQFD